MVILIPFLLLKLRHKLAEARSEENIELLRQLIKNDIIGSIEMNCDVGNISASDAMQLITLAEKLYNHIYSKYYSNKEGDDMRMFDNSLELSCDKY